MKEIEARRQSCGNLNENQNKNKNPSPYAKENNPSCLEENQNRNQKRVQDQHQNQHILWELRLRQQLLRAERDEEVRRELAVGSWPGDRRR